MKTMREFYHGWTSPIKSFVDRLMHTDDTVKKMRLSFKDSNTNIRVNPYSLAKTSYQARIEVITHRNVDYYIDNFFLSSSQNFVGSIVNIFTDDFNSYLDGAPLNSSWWQIPGNLDVCQIKVTNVP
jgi:hypothetical protein